MHKENLNKNNSKISEHVHGSIIICIAYTNISYFMYAFDVVLLVISLYT